MVVNNLEVVGDVIADPYFKAHRPKSVLCLPLASQQKVVGLLYMENSQTSDAFVSYKL
jgi:GAF domain-containing protein